MGGDFNELFSVSEKEGGGARSILNFKEAVNDCNLKDLGSLVNLLLGLHREMRGLKSSLIGVLLIWHGAIYFLTILLLI